MITKRWTFALGCLLVLLGQDLHAQTTNMVLIPAGVFTMGDTFAEGGTEERPMHTNHVSAFYMDKCEVTKALWDDVYQWATNHGYTFSRIGSGKAPNHPVHSVNWFDAVKWCNARSEKEGKTPAYYTATNQTTIYRSGGVDVQNDWVKWNAGYRLPTEAEWEKAARGGLSRTRFPWGDAITHSQANYKSSGAESYDTSPTGGFHPAWNAGTEPHSSPVGAFAPNAYGLYDMTGNMAEWCWDWRGDYSSATQTDPRGPASGVFRTLRGSSWSLGAEYNRTAARDNIRPQARSVIIGFRSVLPLSQP